MADVPELLLIDKPIGITSMDVIRRLRRTLGIKKMGHSGTLDPLATGLMVVGVGPGTKKLAELIKLDKEYITEVRIGESRTTGDLEGDITAERGAHEVRKEAVVEVLAGMIGTLALPVSAYSAVKVGGVPLYKKARKAEVRGVQVIDVPLRDMKVYEAELIDFSAGDRAVATIRFKVGSGTYIRSLGEELGRRLGYPAVLQALRRTKVGDFDIKDSEVLAE